MRSSTRRHTKVFGSLAMVVVLALMAAGCDRPQSPGATAESPVATSHDSISLPLEAIEALLTTERWQPATLTGGESFRWRAQQSQELANNDPDDEGGHQSATLRSDLWGHVEGDEIDRQLSYTDSAVIGTDNDRASGSQHLLVDHTIWSRFGTFDADRRFVPDGSEWEVIDQPTNHHLVTEGLLTTGSQLFNNWGAPRLEHVGLEEIAGTATTHYRSVIVDGGEPGYRIDAEFDFWFAGGSDGPRVRRLTFSAQTVLDTVHNDVVDGTTTMDFGFELYDVGAAVDPINPPS